MKRPRPLRPLLLLFLLCAACAQAQDDLLFWINETRHTAGLNDLAPDSLLSQAAEGWAGRLAGTGVLSHQGVDGSSAMDRYRAVGGTDVRVGEILGAGPNLADVEGAWLKSDEHRAVTLSRSWTHVGWGRGLSRTGEVWVVLFCQKLVDELRIDAETAGLVVSGRFVEPAADHPLLYAGLVPCPPAAWDAQSRRFSFHVPPPLEGYFRLGYVLPGKAYRLTNAFTWPRGTGSPGGSGRFSIPAAPP